MVGGLAVLAKAADVFVVGAARLAVILRLSPVVVGAIVVGFGTGAPELLVSSLAAARGSLDIAAGNVVGSNLANLTLVLGVAGILARPHTVPRVVRREAPLSLATVALAALLLQGGLYRWEGVVLLAGLAGAVVIMLRASRDGDSAADEAAAEYLREVEERARGRARHDRRSGASGRARVAASPLRADVVKITVGLLGTVAGAQLLVVGAQGIATDLGLSGGFVGLTLVAVGTSLPELVTAIQSARRNETALLAGNVLGSNVFNSTAVAGAAALIGPGPLTDPGLTVVAASSMVVIAALAWLFLGYGGRLSRVDGAVLLAIYAATMPFV